MCDFEYSQRIVDFVGLLGLPPEKANRFTQIWEERDRQLEDTLKNCDSGSAAATSIIFGTRGDLGGTGIHSFNTLNDTLASFTFDLPAGNYRALLNLTLRVGVHWTGYIIDPLIQGNDVIVQVNLHGHTNAAFDSVARTFWMPQNKPDSMSGYSEWHDSSVTVAGHGVTDFSWPGGTGTLYLTACGSGGGINAWQLFAYQYSTSMQVFSPAGADFGSFPDTVNG